MIRLTALNEEPEEDTDSEDEVTREALEEIALQQYAKSLELQKKGKYEHALKFLKDLLNTEILYEVQKPEIQDNITRPLLNMKYLCYRNVATISERLGMKEEAIEAYFEALSLDHTDITIWYRLGKLCLECERYNLALNAFQSGLQVNSNHWPCIDSIITLYLGLGDYNSCIITIYDALQLDGEYLRGKAYRKYIYSNYEYVMEYLTALNSQYLWNKKEDADIDDEAGDKLVSEALHINKKYIDQVALNTITPILPVLALEKPIADFTWESVGASLVHMHKYMTEKMFSHACVIDIRVKDLAAEGGQSPQDNKIDVDGCIEDISMDESPDESSKTEATDIELGEKEKIEINKVEVEYELQQAKDDVESCKNSEVKDIKKVPRRRSSLMLGMWEWCKTKGKSSKKKSTKQDRDDTVYESLRKLIPDNVMLSDNKNESADVSPEYSLDTDNLSVVDEDPESSNTNLNTENDIAQYFDSDKERNDVEKYVNKFVNSPADVITMLNDFLEVLASKWDILWPKNLGKYFIEAVSCHRQHFDPPSPQIINFDDIKLYTNVTLCAAEISLSISMLSTDNMVPFDTCDLDLLGMYFIRPELFTDECIITTLRYLWIQSHALIHNEVTEFALEYLYKMMYEFNRLEEKSNTLKVMIPNFRSKSCIQKTSVIDVIKSLERNKQLSSVSSLYEKGLYEEVKQILLNSFKSCQALAHKGEYSSLSLDWAAQLIMLLDTLWALGDMEECFLWATKCLNESLKHYLKSSLGSENSQKWSLSVLKTLVTLEFMIKTEGTYLLNVLPDKKLNVLTSNLLQIICHQIEESSISEMPINTTTPWILLHYIVQIEEDRGRVPMKHSGGEEIDNNKEYIPNSFMVLFMAHEYLGKRSWCCYNEGYLLYFILDTVIPRIKSPALLPSLETLGQYLEQCVFCLFGHPGKKNKSRYFVDHNVTPFKLDWARAQQLFDLYNPTALPDFDSVRLLSISSDTEQLFQRMLALVPPELEVKPHSENVMAYIEGRKDSISIAPVTLPFRVRNIYYLLADYYLKTNESSRALKYFVFDLVLHNDRFNSWAGMALARASLLDIKLNSCENFKSDQEYFTTAVAIERCFQRALSIDASHPMLWIEYGNFVYAVHSYCSRTLKQASESLSMEDFEQLEKRKEAMLDTAEKCFINANREFMVEFNENNKDIQDERWLHHYMLGKVAEKKGRPPEKYLSHYMKAAHFLKLNHAEYPAKINYNNPGNLSVEALEIDYRIHASILKYIEQHENKIIYSSEGKVFEEFINKCAEYFSLSNVRTKENLSEKNTSDVGETVSERNKESKQDTDITASVNSASELKRTFDGTENDQDRKKLKLDENEIFNKSTATEKIEDLPGCEQMQNLNKNSQYEFSFPIPSTDVGVNLLSETVIKTDSSINVTSADNTLDIRRPSHESVPNTASADNSSSTSSSDSSSGESTSDSSNSSSDSSSSKNSQTKPADLPMLQEDIDNIIGFCLDNLEECVSRFNQHYKALYRLAHYHFYFKRGKNVERCRDLMLSSFVARNGMKLQGLFCERKNNNFFNGVWRIPISEIDRSGSFASHMNRCVLLIMEILKEIDDHKTLLDLSLQLLRTPELDKKFLRDSEREELSQQALCLCVQSLKGQLTKFCHQSDLLSNPVEKNALSSLTLDIYRAYQKAQKFPPSKNAQFANLLIDGCKLSGVVNILDTGNALETCVKYCQSLIMHLKQQALNPTLMQNNSNMVNSQIKRTASKVTDSNKVITIPASTFLPSSDLRAAYSKSSLAQNISKPSYLNYSPPVIDPALLPFSNPEMAAALFSYVTSMGGYSNYSGMSTTYQSEIIRQFMTTSRGSSAYMPSMSTTSTSLPKSKSNSSSRGTAKIKTDTYVSKNINSLSQSATKTISSQKVSKSSTNYSMASMQTTAKVSKEPLVSGTRLAATLPLSMPSTLSAAVSNQIKTSYASPITSHLPKTQHLSNAVAKPAHMTTTSTTNAVLHAKPPLPHQQVSPGKTLQEKLAEKQKFYPTISKATSPNTSLQDLTSTFSGKIPSALTITKTSGTSHSSTTGTYKNDEVSINQTLNEEGEGNKNEARKVIQFNDAEVSEKQEAHEVIVLDD